MKSSATLVQENVKLVCHCEGEIFSGPGYGLGNTSTLPDQGRIQKSQNFVSALGVPRWFSTSETLVPCSKSPAFLPFELKKKTDSCSMLQSVCSHPASGRRDLQEEVPGHTHTHTHGQTHMCACVRACVCVDEWGNPQNLHRLSTQHKISTVHDFYGP